jgi:uncharacterized protein with HEPN domain
MKDDRIYLLHIRDSVDRIIEYTSQGKGEFLTEPQCITMQQAKDDRIR